MKIARSQQGFSLAELAIVTVIVGLLLGGMLVSLSASRDVGQITETRKQLASISEALIGFAAAKGRLPCPAAPPVAATDRGTESPASGGVCTNPHNGFLPAADLGISPTDGQGFATDSWGNRIRYAVTASDSNAFTTTNGIKAAWPSLPSSLSPDIQVCATTTGKTGSPPNSSCAASSSLVSSGSVAVIFSTGKNGGATPSDPDELQNWQSTSDRLFVSQTETSSFDDIVIWISPHILYNRMLSAGRLP